MRTVTTSTGWLLLFGAAASLRAAPASAAESMPVSVPTSRPAAPDPPAPSGRETEAIGRGPLRPPNGATLGLDFIGAAGILGSVRLGMGVGLRSGRWHVRLVTDADTNVLRRDADGSTSLDLAVGTAAEYDLFARGSLDFFAFGVATIDVALFRNVVETPVPPTPPVTRSFHLYAVLQAGVGARAMVAPRVALAVTLGLRGVTTLLSDGDVLGDATGGLWLGLSGSLKVIVFLGAERTSVRPR